MISFVGAGPGAYDLITLRGAKRLADANIVIWASSLVPEELLSHAHPNALVYDSSTMTLEEVLSIYQDHQDAAIVRLHSGDPSLYGAIQEQIDWCVDNHRDFEVVPGVSSLAASAAVLGRELTIPGASQSIIITRMASRTRQSVPEGESIEEFTSHGCTMALFLSTTRPSALQNKLLTPSSGYTIDTPVAIVVRATQPGERTSLTTLGNLAKELHRLKASKTTMVIVSEALTARPRRSHLYSPSFSHSHRRRSPHKDAINMNDLPM